MPRTIVSFRGLLLVFGLVAVGLPIALVGELGTVRTLNAINAGIADIREGQLAVGAAVQDQLDEESAVRGFAATGSRALLEPYDRAIATLPSRFQRIVRLAGIDGQPPPAAAAIADMRGVNAAWIRTVAVPIVAGRDRRAQRLVHGKALIDRFRADAARVESDLHARYALATARRDDAIRTTTFVSVFAILIIGVEIVVFGGIVLRLRYELDRERRFAETLQTAAAGRLVPPVHLAIATAYRSATRGARIGGDVYDVYRLDGDRTLIVIGDVSGKGVTAVVDTTFVRYALRALAAEGLGASEVVARFDALYSGAGGPPEAFVTLFAGIHDRRDGSLAYTNAGHEACWIRRADGTALLPPTGPIVGLGSLPFEAVRTTLSPGETLVLATDGLTEARDPNGTFVPIDVVTSWIAAADASTPKAMIDGLLVPLARHTRGRIVDDLALLVVQPRR